MFCGGEYSHYLEASEEMGETSPKRGVIRWLLVFYQFVNNHLRHLHPNRKHLHHQKNNAMQGMGGGEGKWMCVATVREESISIRVFLDHSIQYSSSWFGSSLMCLIRGNSIPRQFCPQICSCVRLFVGVSHPP